MKKYLVFPALAVVAVVAMGAQRPEVRPAEGPVLRVEPSKFRIEANERKLVHVRVVGIPEQGLAAFQVELKYDPQVVDLVDPNAGYGVPAFAPLGGSPLCATIRQTFDCHDPQWMLTAAGRQAVGTVAASPDEGSLTIAYGTMGAGAPVSGEGVLIVLAVVGRASGRTELELGAVILADDNDPPGRYAPHLKSGHPPPRRTRGR